MTSTVHATLGEPDGGGPVHAAGLLARRGWLALLLALAAVGTVQAQERQERATPAAIKAAFLSKFLNYIDLPASAPAQRDNPLVIGVAGADDVHQALLQLLKERGPDQRRLVARRLAEGDSLAGVQLLFVGASIDPLHSSLVRAVRERALLLVTDSPDGLKAGACINFVNLGNRVRFEISLDAAEQHSIRISSRVLALAERVIGAH
ncbi:MAG TPA: YfiR family protein [Albitalea sp.]|nr:YfiR family protein [Albitalea sp.]